MKTRDVIRDEALSKLEENNYVGTLVLNTGAGKSKIAIEAVKQGGFKNILITSPRTNLIRNWELEIKKWGLKANITIKNIQTTYKWLEKDLKKFDIIILDEIHSFSTPEYGVLVKRASKLGIKRIGLTATPDISRKEEKLEFYKEVCPIIYVYTDSEEDKITNKKKIVVFYYDLDNFFQYEVQTKSKSWLQGEKAHYEYLEKVINETTQEIRTYYPHLDVLGVKAIYALKNNSTPAPLKNILRKYWWGITQRKKLLWNLKKSAHLALILKKDILRHPDNKVLIFSELTDKCNKLSDNTIHSKQEKDKNQIMIEAFNADQIRELASCQSLTLGMNLVGANYAIFESFNSSETNNLQKQGRLNRLPVNENAVLIYLVPRNTQAQIWFEKATENQDVKVITSLKDWRRI